MNAPPPDQIRLVIIGATGMVGGYALRYALAAAAVGNVTAIGRRSLGIAHPKLKEVLHRDFADCSALADALAGQDAAVFCLGAYTGAVSDTELRKVTVDYTIEFARVLRISSPAAAFSFLSGSGADPTGRSRLAFARYKGEAENALLAAGFPSLPHTWAARALFPQCRAARLVYRVDEVALSGNRLEGVAGRQTRWPQSAIPRCSGMAVMACNV